MPEQLAREAKLITPKKAFIAIAILLALIATPQFVYLFEQTHYSDKAFTAFSEALIARDYARAYNLTSSEFQSAISESTFARQQAALCSNLGALKKVRRGSFETEEHGGVWSTDLTAYFHFEHGDRQFDFSMKKQATIWKVYGYKERD
jgi:hypothetical protein